MDIASLVGLVGAIGAILAAMIAGGGVAPFIDTQSIFIVFGGTFFAVMYAWILLGKVLEKQLKFESVANN